MKLIARIALGALALVLAAMIVPGVEVQGLYSAVIAACILGIVNALVRPVLVLFTLPITIVTLGLFIFVINAALFYFVASFIDGFSVDGFLAALGGSLVVSVITAIGNRFIA
jgi:putative membrane protein